MESVDAKMVRAKEHLDTLHAEAGVFFESTKRNFILKSNGLTCVRVADSWFRADHGLTGNNRP